MSILLILIGVATTAVIAKKTRKMHKRSQCKQARDMRKIQKLERFLDMLKSRAGVATVTNWSHQSWCTGTCGGQCAPEGIHREWCKGNCGGQCAPKEVTGEQEKEVPQFPTEKGDDSAKEEKKRLQERYQEVSEPPEYVKV